MRRGASGMDGDGPTAKLRRAQASHGIPCFRERGGRVHSLHGHEWSCTCSECCCHLAVPVIAEPVSSLAVVEHRHVGWRPALRRRRVLLYSHDTFGLGHLRRNLAIARQLLSSPAGFEVMLLTGSPMQSDWPLPNALTVRALPPVVKVGEENYGPRDHSKNFALLKGHRQALILQAALLLLSNRCPKIAGHRNNLCT